MRKKFFFKNITIFLIPLLIPILVLGSLSIVITQHYIKDQISKNNVNLLSQTKENIGLILSELDSLTLNFSSNPRIAKNLKDILNKQSLTLDDKVSITEIRSFIDAPANARSYIDSIYIYLNNDKNKFMTTTDGLVDLKNYYDTSWFQTYINQKSSNEIWVEPRAIKRYEFEKEATGVVTMYRRLFPSAIKKDGAIILNIRTDYIEKQLIALDIPYTQCILVLNENNNVIFSNNRLHLIDKNILSEVEKSVTPNFLISSDFDSYTVSQLEYPRFGLRFISIVPHSTLYSMPILIRRVTIILLFVSFALGLILAIYFTNKNYKQVSNIISILDSAERGYALPQLTSQIKDEYTYIVQNIIKTFVEQSYLKVQLSERKFKQQAAELLALQSQINPHFLFNTMETIYWGVIQIVGKPTWVNTMIENLSDILKYSLESPTHLITLDQEIKNTTSYIAIQRFRYDNKFDVIWEYDEELNNYKIIKFILQPLIENSIYHGIKEKDGKSLIKVKILKFESYLAISVIDNGLGIPKETLINIRRKLKEDQQYSDHIGLYNTNRRLKLTYGDKAEIKVLSKSGKGTIIRIYLYYSKPTKGVIQ